MVPHEELAYVLYARAFGWTPDEVDNVPLRLEPYLLPIDAAIGADIKRRSEKAQADAEYKARHRK